jgi:hypothetical protein
LRAFALLPNLQRWLGSGIVALLVRLHLSTLVRVQKWGFRGEMILFLRRTESLASDPVTYTLRGSAGVVWQRLYRVT